MQFPPCECDSRAAQWLCQALVQKLTLTEAEKMGAALPARIRRSVEERASSGRDPLREGATKHADNRIKVVPALTKDRRTYRSAARQRARLQHEKNVDLASPVHCASNGKVPNRSRATKVWNACGLKAPAA